MPIAVTLRLDAAATEGVARLLRALAAAGEAGAAEPDYPPHLTLARVTEEAAPAAAIERAVRLAAAGLAPLPLRLGALGVFPGEVPVAWAAPVVTSPLLALHGALLRALAPLPVDPLDLPGAWMPHVTLGRSAAAAAAAWAGPIEGRLDRLEIVRFPPPEVLWTGALPLAADPLARLRELCLELPEAAEKETWDAPTWRVRDRIYAMARQGEERLEFWCKAPPGAQAVLVGADPARFFAPPYVGPKGWIGVRLAAPGLAAPDWAEVAALIRRSYRMTAPRRLASGLEDPG